VVGPQQPLLARVLGYVAWVNLGWGLLNLLPVLPLDGGTIVVTVAQSLWGSAGVRIARIISLGVCVALGAAALAAGWIWSAIIAGVLALANLQALRSDGSHPRDVGVVPGPGAE
jgi:Zn-dependent protease